MYYVYVIYNKLANKFYIGQTHNVTERLKIHNAKLFRGYTSRFDGDWEVIYYEKVQDRNQALRREKQLKSFKGRQFIRQYIPG